ncbi:MAG: condensation domain-containing protein, partial [Pseudomonadota bacterium]
DLNRTLGWFTSLYPVRLDLRGIDAEEAWQGHASAGQALKSIKEQLRAIPDKGLGYGQLKELNPDTAPELGQLPIPQVAFNYLGRFEQQIEGSWSLAPTLPSDPDPQQRRLHLIDINAIIDADGCLAIHYSYAREAFEQATLSALADDFCLALKVLTQHCLKSPLTQRLGLSDVPASVRAQLDQRLLAQIEQAVPGLETIVPLTPLQQGLLFETQRLEPGVQDPYHVQFALQLQGELDEARLESAWRRLIARHQVLRLQAPRAAREQGLGVIAPALDLQWQRLDASQSTRPGATDLSVIDAWLAADKATAFDLEHGPLVRACLIRTAPGTYAFLYSHHHALLDGWSNALLMEELVQSYQGKALLRTLSWSTHAERIASLDTQDASNYWREYLKDLTPTLLQLPAVASLQAGMGEVLASLDAVHSAQLAAYGARHGLTTASMLQGLYALLIGQLARSDDVVIGTTRAGREGEDPLTDRAVGLFINTLPLRAQIDPSEPLADWLATLQQAQAEQAPHAQLSLGTVQRLAGTGTLFEAMFVFENYPSRLNSQQFAPDVQITHGQGVDGTHYPLALSAGGTEVLQLRLTFDRSRLDDGQAHCLLQRYQSLLQQLGALAEQSNRQSEPLLAHLQFVNEEESAQLAAFNATDHALDSALLLPDLFAAQVIKTPHATALVFEDSTLTYAELDARSSQLARHLITLGAGPEVRVAIGLERSVELIVAILAVLKSGAAYVPLGPDYPVDRLSYMLTDSAALFVLATRDLAERLTAAGSAGGLQQVLLNDPSVLDALSILSAASVTDADR